MKNTYQLRRSAKCYNCKFASSSFKIVNLSHCQCLHEKHQEGLKTGTLTAWDTLRTVFDTCESHELKPKKQSK